MEEILETAGQAILAAMSATVIIGITAALVFMVNGPTLGSFLFTALDSLLP